MSFVKEVSGTEKFFIAYNEQRPPFVIQLVLEGEGDPSPDDLYDALEKTTAANPGSSLRWEKDGMDLNWITGPPPTLTVVDAPDYTGESEANAPFYLWPMDAHEGPTCELLYVKGKNHTYLVFRALHAVMDGMGTLLWVQDFMRCLRGEEPVGHPSTLTVDDLILNMSTKKRRLPFPDALHPLGIAEETTQGQFYWQRILVDRKLDSNMVGRIAVTLAERARSEREGLVRINLPTDLRHYCPKERTTGNFFSSLFLDVPPGATPEAIGLKIIQMIYKKEGTKRPGIYSSDEVGSLAIFRVKLLYDIEHLHDTGLYVFSSTISHLGMLKSDLLSAPGFKAMGAFFPPLVGDSGCVISINGFDEKTEACVGLSDRFLKHNRLEDLAAQMKSAIEG